MSTCKYQIAEATYWQTWHSLCGHIETQCTSPKGSLLLGSARVLSTVPQKLLHRKVVIAILKNLHCLVFVCWQHFREVQGTKHYAQKGQACRESEDLCHQIFCNANLACSVNENNSLPAILQGWGKHKCLPWVGEIEPTQAVLNAHKIHKAARQTQCRQLKTNTFAQSTQCKSTNQRNEQEHPRRRAMWGT